MEKENKKLNTKKEKIETKANNKLTDKQKEIIITIIVLVASVVVGFFIGKTLFEVMYG